MSEFIKEIFNKELKERFLNEINLEQYPPRWWERVFEKSYIFEKNNGKDLCQFTTPEIIEFYKFLDVLTLEPLMIYNSNLIKYGQWALNNNLLSDNQNHFSEITNSILIECINKINQKKSILSLKEFKDFLVKIKNEQDRFVFFCLFEGIKGKDYKEIVEMKLSDIDQKNNTVTLYNGRVIKIPQDFITVAIDANNQKEYENYGKNSIVRPLIPSEKIYKQKSNSTKGDVSRMVYSAVIRVFTDLGMQDYCSSKTIWNSGFIHYLNKRSDELGTPVEDLFNNPNKIQDIIDKYNFNIFIRKRFLLSYESFLH